LTSVAFFDHRSFSEGGSEGGFCFVHRIFLEGGFSITKFSTLCKSSRKSIINFLIS